AERVQHGGRGRDHEGRGRELDRERAPARDRAAGGAGELVEEVQHHVRREERADESKQEEERRPRVLEADAPALPCDHRPEERRDRVHRHRDRERRHACAPPLPAVAPAGRSIEKRRPPASERAAATVPPCASTVRRTIARPSPVPVCFSEKKGSKRRGSASSGTPGPLSSTVTRHAPFARRSASPRRRASLRDSSASSAFSSRLMSTWRSFSRSARTPMPRAASTATATPASSKRSRNASAVSRTSSPRSNSSNRNSSRRAKR